MVKTWEASWFAERGTGTRVLYTVPRPITDSILPLTITPTPDETVRVLVGRIDVLTPEQEEAIASMLPSEGTRMPLEQARQMRALGRFLQPTVERAGDVHARKLMRAIAAGER